MSAKPTTMPSGTFPDPPPGWLPSEFADKTGPWVLGRAELKTDAADDSGPRKALAVLIPLAWAVILSVVRFTNGASG